MKTPFKTGVNDQNVTKSAECVLVYFLNDCLKSEMNNV